MKKTTKQPYPYTATIKVFGKVYKSMGYTIQQALDNLTVGGKIGGASILSISNGKETKDKVLNINQANRLFSSSRLIKEVAIKNLSLLFGNL